MASSAPVPSEPAPASQQAEAMDKANSSLDHAGSTASDPKTAPCQKPAPDPSPALSNLTPAEFRQYNRLATHMDQFHAHFRQTWNTLYSTASSARKPAHLSIRQFLALGLEFCQQLTLHHTIEEQHIFPVLARRMPRFKEASAEAGELLRQHEQIHRGLEGLEAWLEECRGGAREVRWGELKEVMDTFGGVLWSHLDEEVKELGAENMRKFWSLDEMRRMPM